MPGRAHRAYSQEEKAETVGRALSVGSKQTSRETGIPRRTIDYWFNHPTFAPLRQRAREEVAERMWLGVQLAVDELTDGLQNPKTPLRDKAIVLQTLYDRWALLTGSATSRSENRDITGSLEDRDLIDALREAERLVTAERAAPETEGQTEG